MASVKPSKKSPYWMAAVRVWKAVPDHPDGGVLFDTLLSTKVPSTEPKEVALRVAAEMERIGREGMPGGPMRSSRDYFESRVDALMRAAGFESVVKDATWREFSDRWLDECEAGLSSLIKYRGEVGQFTKFLGARSSLSIREVVFDDCRRFHADLIKTGRTQGTARNTLKTIRAVLDKAKALGYIVENPANPQLLKLKTGKLRMPRKPFSRAEVKMIFDYLDAAGLTQWRVACLFGLYYGMRIGDAVSRRFDEIGEEDGMPVIRFVPEKKARSGQVVTLPLVAELAKLRRGQDFITPRLSKYAQPTKPFMLVLRDAKITILRAKAKDKGRSTGDKGFHSFRHTINSRLSDAGVDVRIRQLICDHDDLKTSMKYTHSSLEVMAEAIQKTLGTP